MTRQYIKYMRTGLWKKGGSWGGGAKKKQPTMRTTPKMNDRMYKKDGKLCLDNGYDLGSGVWESQYLNQSRTMGEGGKIQNKTKKQPKHLHVGGGMEGEVRAGG